MRRFGAVGMAGHLDRLPRVESAQDPSLHLDEFPFELAELFLLLASDRRRLERRNLILDLVDRFFQGQAVEAVGHG